MTNAGGGSDTCDRGDAAAEFGDEAHLQAAIASIDLLLACLQSPLAETNLVLF